ncbi:MAG TPA: MFS transporter, partial [Anaerolinea sp.]|nr:MFS transporter [Anaerolinea sp.]
MKIVKGVNLTKAAIVFPIPRPRGMTAYIVISFGQMVSMIGSAMTSFALGVWAWELTGQATALVLVAVFSAVPLVLFSPIAGALVDRQHNKKWVMMISDLASALVTFAYLLISSAGQLQIWHLYAGAAFVGCFSSFQWPAYTAATALMLPQAQYSRASGISSLVSVGSGLLAPLLAGTLFSLIGLPGIFLIDLTTFGVAILTLLWILLPSSPGVSTAAFQINGLWSEAWAGLRYLLARPNLLGVQFIFSIGNFFFNLSGILITPMILARTNTNTVILGLVASSASVGALLGGLLMSAWKGPKRKIHGILSGWLALGLVSVLPYSTNAGLPVWMAASMFSAFIPTV